jgi:peptidoglycan/xylan/chitin deacetylase (PgdA/CDA1 family)
MNNIIVTTSWDDGHVLDLKLADLLSRYNLPATFYISPEDREIVENDRLTKAQVNELSKKAAFEIGAHTMTHPLLSNIDDAAAKNEIERSKVVLEDWTGKEIKSFCYPAGNFQVKHEHIVKNAKFSLARTVKRFSTTIGKNPFEMPTTIHAYRHWSDIVPIFKESGVTKFLSYYFNWDELAIALFDRIYRESGVFHLWGHSWEIEKNGDWDRLERVFKHIADRSGVHYMTNNELI